MFHLQIFDSDRTSRNYTSLFFKLFLWSAHVSPKFSLIFNASLFWLYDNLIVALLGLQYDYGVR